MPQISRNWNVTLFTHPLPVSVTQPNSLITWGWGFSFFITSSSDRRSFLSEAGAFAKRKPPQKFSFFLPLLYYGNRFAVVSFFQCSLSTWSFLFRLHRNHPTERDVFFKYSRLPITKTFKGNRKKVRVIVSWKKIAEIKVKNSFNCTVNILINFNCRNVKWKLKDTSR